MDEVRQSSPGGSAGQKLFELLDAGGASYRVIEHAAEGRTEEVSALRGHPAEQAAKCIVVRVKVTKKESKYVLAVVPGDQRLSLEQLKGLYEAKHALFADTDTAERLSGSPSGTILPFSFDPALDLVVDPGLLKHDTIYFNAAALDRSLALATADYVRLAEPSVQAIAGDAPAAGP